MRFWVSLAVVVLGGCYTGPSTWAVHCYQGCGNQKDACILAASTPAQLQACDAESAGCTAACQ
jgi:hypothetical protein